MIYENCRRIIKAAVDNGMIQTVPDGEYAGYLLVYKGTGTDPKQYPEGWYAEPFDDVVDALMHDRAGQRFLKKRLQERKAMPELIDEVAFRKNTELSLEIADFMKFCEESGHAWEAK